MPQVRADLICATGAREGSDKRGAVFETLQNLEGRAGFVAVGIDQVNTAFCRFASERCLTRQFVCGRMPVNFRQIGFPNQSILKLLLHDRGDSFAFAEHHDAGSISVESMDNMRSAGEPDQIQDIAERVAVKSSARMNRQRCWF